MIKIFAGNKTFHFTNNADGLSEDVIKFENSIHKDELKKIFSDSKSIEIVCLCHNAESGFKEFTKMFRNIDAAGGVVYNHEKKLLLIHRLGKWDLPKGKMEDGESPETSAMREVCEETGVCNLEIIKPLRDTFHIYQQNGEYILKRTYWFEMITSSATNLLPQTEENITEVKWMTKEEVNAAMQFSYESIRYLLSQT
ncbi:MAG TPA: NUDIX domain-containing protein [Bacteroidia bacterium]|nr:NUDIX domain-containing protein [Bacteroidia bacterium]MBP7714102.1 NUDIX domain-containing protein [Bacteroidia bacterium]MBP8668723.1 NUDIX domain-containing protein [Bacteroidia bacterium]HOZ81749.1 NUDIX domain-containing protein [Bacteroidia bacterium]HOZ91395.1 NUDIX domain-containing protein [Bacteroidia bacterium]